MCLTTTGVKSLVRVHTGRPIAPIDHRIINFVVLHGFLLASEKIILLYQKKQISLVLQIQFVNSSSGHGKSYYKGTKNINY